MGKYNEAIQNIARGMLKANLVEEVVSFVQDSNGGNVIPQFISDEKDADKISTMSYYPCSLANLLAQYGDKNKKTGLIVRACDARALLELVKRQQLKLENLYTVGIECYGVVRAIDKKQEIYIFPEKIEVGGELKPLDEGIIASNCLRCEYTVPTMADVSCRIESDGKTTAKANTEKGKKILEAANIPDNEGATADNAFMKERAAKWQEKDFGELKAMKPIERLNYWLSQFDKCIKCYGCRNSCPICYCEDCYLEADRLLIQKEVIPPEKLFHITRMMHVGDSCVNCGQCETACPMEIPISRLYHMFHQELSSIFKYEAGLDVDSLPPISSITEGDLMKTGVSLD